MRASVLDAQIRRMHHEHFDEIILPHLDAAYNLARWLVRGDEADDVAQEACLRAFRYFGTFRGGNARAWLLTIVRTTAYRWLERNRADLLTSEVSEDQHGAGVDVVTPETLLLQRADAQLLHRAMNHLPVRLREVLMLRELEGLSYKDIAEVAGIPIGTVMSTLSRARERFRQAVTDLIATGSQTGLGGSRVRLKSSTSLIQGPRGAAADDRHAPLTGGRPPSLVVSTPAQVVDEDAVDEVSRDAEKRGAVQRIARHVSPP